MKQLTSEQQKLVEDNHSLIYSFLKSRNLSMNAVEDWYGVAAIGLCKAAMAYNESKGSFATLAYRVMENEVRRTMREKHRDPDVAFSLDDLIDEADSDTVANFYPDKTDEIAKFTDAEVLYRALDQLTTRERDVIMYMLDTGCAEIEAAKHIDRSPQYIHKVCRKLRNVIMSNNK